MAFDSNLVQNLLNPTLLALKVLLILVVGWIIAKVVAKLVRKLILRAEWLTNILSSEKEGEREKIALAKGMGKAVYYLIMLFVLSLVLTALNLEQALDPIKDLLSEIVSFIPNLIAGVVIILMGYFIGSILKTLVKGILSKTRFDRFLAKSELDILSGRGNSAPSAVLSTALFYIILTLALLEALKVVGLTQIAGLLLELIEFAFGNLLVALIVLAAGFFIAKLVGKIIIKSKINNAKTISIIAKVAIIFLSTTMALRQLNIAPEIINMAFGLTLGALAVAAAIAFGIGGKDTASDLLKDMKKSKKSKK